MLKGKLPDLSDTRTKVVLGVAAGTLAAAGALYYISRPSPEEALENSPEAEAGVVEEEAVKEEEEVVEVAPEVAAKQAAEAKKLEGTDFFKSSAYDRAISCYLEAIDLFPAECAVEKSHCYQNIAAASEKVDRLSDVVKYCTAALRLNQKYIKALHRRAGAHEKLKNYAASIKDWTAVCLIVGPQQAMQSGYMAISDRVLKLYGEEQAKILMAQRTPRLPSHTVISAALDNIHMRDFEDSTDPETLENEGDRLYLEVLADLKSKSYDGVVGKLERALTGDVPPQKFLHHIRCLRGIFAAIMSDTATAIACFDAVITDRQSYLRLKVQSHIHRGEAYQARGDRNRALSDYSAAVGLDEDHPDTYLHRGQFYLSIEALQPALDDLKKSIELDDEFPAPWTQLVYGQYQMARTLTPGLLDEVFRNLDIMVIKFPDCADVFALYGQVLQDQRQFAASEERFNEARLIAPHNVTYKAHLATLKLMAENNFDSALVLLKEAMEEDPKCDFVLENLGMIYIQKQEYKEALECFERALELVKTEAEAAHVSALHIGLKSQWEVCAEYGVKPVSINDLQGFGDMTPS